MTYILHIPYLGTFFFSRYPSVALARNNLRTATVPQKNRCTSPRAFFAYEVETFAGGVELLRHWGRRPKARVGVAVPPASSASAPAAIIARSSSSSQVPCTPLLPTLLLPIDGRGAQHLELMLRDGERDDRVAPVDLLALR